MIPKRYKLTTKEVNYILSQRKYMRLGNFLIYNIPQYPNRHYNQFAIQLSSKLHKRSTKRNTLKRAYYDMILTQWLIDKKNKFGRFAKYIILIDKNKISDISNIISSWKDRCREVCNDMFTWFF